MTHNRRPSNNLHHVENFDTINNDITERRYMKKFLTSALFSIICTTTFAANMPWWQQPTVCQLDTTKCYATMGTGYDAEMWDSDSRCWGLKMICPDALKSGTNTPKPMNKNEIKRGTDIKSDFDTNLLSFDNECFGRRKTDDNGAVAMVNGKYVNVYCRGILNKFDEELPNGEITYNAQPTCTDLASNGYAAVLNGNCYGKYYNDTKYHIECGNELLPERIIVLNGANYGKHTGNAPTTMNDANDMFDKMYKTSQTRKKQYFPE